MFKKYAALLSALCLTATLMLPMTAAEFTPSATAKPAPEVVQVQSESGESVGAIIYDESGNEVAGVPTASITVTPVAEMEQADTEIKEALTSAYEQLTTVKLETLVPELVDAVKNYSADMQMEDLVARDLFDVSLNEAEKKMLAESGNSIKLKFDLDLPADALLLVLHNYEGDKWECIPNEKVTRHDDGSVTVAFDSLSPIAFLTDGATLPVDPDGPDSPQTGDTEGISAGWIVLGVTAVVTVAVVGIIRKKHTAKV